MSPAEKFWLGILLLFILFLIIICPVFAVIIIPLHQLITFIGYVVNMDTQYTLTGYKKTFWYKTSLVRVIIDFNNFLNKNFNKNGKI